MIIGIIGGIGSGKSEASKIIKDFGKVVLDCDQIYNNIILDKTYVEKIKEHFSECVVDEKIDKTKLGSIVFKDKNKLILLNSIAHPLVKEKLKSEITKYEKQDVYVEVSAFIGSGLEEGFFDKIIMITSDMKYRIARIMARNNYTKDYVKLIISKQPKDDELEKYADFIIVNNKDITYLRQQICKII